MDQSDFPMGSLQRSPDLLAGFKGPTSRQGEKTEGEGKKWKYGVR